MQLVGNDSLRGSHKLGLVQTEDKLLALVYFNTSTSSVVRVSILESVDKFPPSGRSGSGLIGHKLNDPLL